MERLYFIVNSLSGGGRCGECFKLAQAEMHARGIPYEWVETKHRKHAVELARIAYESGERRIVAVGGDGSINEVASALAGTDAVMGVLPFGTGNDLAKVIGLSTEPLAALETLLAGNVRQMDACDANGCFFINVAGFGFDVDVLMCMEKYKARYKKGMLPYLLGILDALAHLKSLPIKIHMPDGSIKEMDAVLVAVGNGTHFGGGMKAVPDADPFDGLMDVCAIRKVSLVQFLFLLPRFIKGKHVGLKIVDYFRADSLYVEGPESSVLDVDGELYSHAPARFTLQKQALNMLVGAKGA